MILPVKRFCVQVSIKLFPGPFTSPLGLEYELQASQAIQIQRSLGVQGGKSDPVDARRIALDAYKNRQEARLWMPRKELVEQLKILLILRERFLNSLSRLRKPIEELKSHGNPRIAQLIEDFSQGAIEGTLKALALDRSQDR